MAEMALERGLLIHSSCIWRWVQIYGPELDKRCRAHLKRTNKSYRVDETYIRIKGQDRYLYELWIRSDRRLTSYSRSSARPRERGASFLTPCSTPAIRRVKSSTWARSVWILTQTRLSKRKAH